MEKRFPASREEAISRLWRAVFHEIEAEDSAPRKNIFGFARLVGLFPSRFFDFNFAVMLEGFKFA